MQRIIVKNFGPLKDIDLEIKDYMVFLGPQASGKSTLAKLIYFGKDLQSIIFRFFSYFELQTESEFNLDGLFNYIRRELFSVIEKNNSHFEIEFYFEEKTYIKIFSNFEKEVTEIDNLSKKILEKLITDVKEFYSFSEPSDKVTFEILHEKINSKNIIKHLQLIFGDYKRVYFLPDNRSFYNINSYIPVNGPIFFEDINESIDSKFKKEITKNRKNFEKGFEGFEYIVKNRSNSFSKKELELCKYFEKKILKGKYISGQNDKIILENDIIIDLVSSSSGQKESIWLLVFLYDKIFLNRKNNFVIIEEPEAHLFPEAQKDITYLISLLANQEGNQVIITTHSHYILGALNILINAYRIGQTNPEEVEKIVPRELWVNKDRIFAGFLENGIIKNIYDDEAEMIKIQQLNAVAGEINKDFDRLLDLEFANENV
ncbi:hypothetical protein EMA8858_00558 [Emticicia aquatica]|uniref:Endonuclease GajA/Old nuclease/RecF-like AAA domain-containing protein n=1 Tax=Emticicia aquatica TaxID=1681835 RepID=A0ABM9AL16_9BACT|nr:AAA family ATPase [Emticicia aquatica]CAH0994448.1 hypothetical protein EMA8858_00558 [Emticicia aquatica]